MADHKARIQVKYLLEALPFEHVLTLDLGSLGLQPRGEDRWVYNSRSFALLGYSIRPQLHCSADSTTKQMKLSIDRVDIDGLPDIQPWIQFSADLRLTRQAEGVAVAQELQIGLCRQGVLALTPAAVVNRLLNTALEQTSARVGKALRRRLQAAMREQESIHG